MKEKAKIKFTTEQLEFIAKEIAPYAHWPTGINQFADKMSECCEDFPHKEFLSMAHDAWEEYYQSKQEEIEDWVA
tara:strand:+ start:228 stop:452 length:225 start_codon:yes stop_codon:yes gene_type:complete